MFARDLARLLAQYDNVKLHRQASGMRALLFCGSDYCIRRRNLLALMIHWCPVSATTFTIASCI